MRRAPSGRCVCTQRVAALVLSVRNDVTAAILTPYDVIIRNPAPSVDAYLHEEQPCQISSGSALKRWSVKACPHCRRKVRLLQKSATVAVVSPFSATVAPFCESLTFLRQCGQGFRLLLKSAQQQQ